MSCFYVNWFRIMMIFQIRNIFVMGHTLITLAHRGTYLLGLQNANYSTVRVVGYCSKNANKGT